MGLLFSFFTVVALVLIVFIGVKAANLLDYLFGVIIPYLAFLHSLQEAVYRVMKWVCVPVPFLRIPTTAGQIPALDKQNKIDNRSLLLRHHQKGWKCFYSVRFQNTRAELRDGPNLSYGSTEWLWAAGSAFHWTFLIILIRHFRSSLVQFPCRLK